MSDEQTIDDGGPAFPRDEWTKDGNHFRQHNGMTLRSYAAIKLRMPYSGIDWLDKMIWMAKRDEFAGQALAGMLANPSLCYWRTENGIEIDKFIGREALALKSYQAADAMMKARAQ